MNPYVIAPSVVKIALDPELCAQFPSLNVRLNWRTLTTHLESCEDPPYLYFRVTLQLKAGNMTYAGFSTGAPFMLTRDKDARKRAFFLRHWIRKTAATENLAAPLTSLPHMSIAALGDELLLIRVNIDRPLVSSDTFKSVPFATWMFQVVQVDAIIQEKPWIRLAFAIERTVTADERDVVSASGLNLPSKGPKVKQAPTLLARPNSVPSQESPQSQITSRPPRPTKSQPTVHPPMQPTVIHRPNTAYTPVNPRPPAASYQPNPYAYISNRPVSVQMRQNVAPRPQYVQQQPVKGSSKTYNRSNVSAGTSSAQPSVDHLRPVMHPYLRLWEDRDLDDPYEPIFVTEDEEFEKKAKRSWLVEETPEHAKQFQYEKLFGVPTADYPTYYFSCPTLSNADGEPDLEVVVKRKQRVKAETSELTGVSGEDDSEGQRGEPGRYSSAILAASDYNSMLRDDRSQLRNWLVEENVREQEESEEDEDEDEGDGDYSD